MIRLLPLLLLALALAWLAGPAPAGAAEPAAPPAEIAAAGAPTPAAPGTAAPRGEVRRNQYPDGALRTQWQVRIEPDGTVVRHGSLLRYHPNGRLALRGAYRDGRPTGIWRWYSERGGLLRATVPQGDYEEILSGHELEHPNSVYRDPQGRKTAEGLRKYDLPHGAWTYYHPGGAVKAQGRYLNGLLDGRWVFYFPTGQVERLEDYRLGIADGEVLRGWPNGQEQLEGRMEQGLRVGTWRTWHRDGQLESEGVYREDRREGVWRFWDAQGKLVRHVRYAAGQVAEELPLPLPPPSVAPRIVTDPHLLPFRPRIYNEDGEEIDLLQDELRSRPPRPAPPARPRRKGSEIWGELDPGWRVVEPAPDPAPGAPRGTSPPR
jgi:antitoxin component YwqK of YwqJK toxin-antitoxin module